MAGSVPLRVELLGPEHGASPATTSKSSKVRGRGFFATPRRSGPVRGDPSNPGPCRWTGKHRRWRQWRSGPFRQIAVKDPRSAVATARRTRRCNGTTDAPLQRHQGRAVATARRIRSIYDRTRAIAFSQPSCCTLVTVGFSRGVKVRSTRRNPCSPSGG